jgi:carbonic anhydrase
VESYFTPHHIVGLRIEEILVYRNLAHLVNYTDLNCLAVLQYAIEILNVNHVIVCGHYDCAVLLLSAKPSSADLAENWLHPVDIYRKYERGLGEYQPETLRLEKLWELNVIEQVVQLCKTTVVQNAWKRRQALIIHGWAYSSEKGHLNDLATDIAGEHDIFPAYQAAIENCIGKA